MEGRCADANSARRERCNAVCGGPVAGVRLRGGRPVTGRHYATDIGAMYYQTTGPRLPLLHLYGSAAYALIAVPAIVAHVHRVPTVGMDQGRVAMHVA